MKSKYGNRGKRSPYHDDRDNPALQWREVYRSQQNLMPKTADPYDPLETSLQDAPAARRRTSGAIAAAWHVHTEQFTPRHTHFTPRRGRVMLYAYGSAGIVDWDDVVVKQIAPPPDRFQSDVP